MAKPDCVLAVCQWLSFLELGNTPELLRVIHCGKLLDRDPRIEVGFGVNEVDGSDNLNDLCVLVSFSALDDFCLI